MKFSKNAIYPNGPEFQLYMNNLMFYILCTDPNPVNNQGVEFGNVSLISPGNEIVPIQVIYGEAVGGPAGRGYRYTFTGDYPYEYAYKFKPGSRGGLEYYEKKIYKSLENEKDFVIDSAHIYARDDYIGKEANANNRRMKLVCLKSYDWKAEFPLWALVKDIDKKGRFVLSIDKNIYKQQHQINKLREAIYDSVSYGRYIEKYDV
jgi:hypothetical protein